MENVTFYFNGEGQVTTNNGETWLDIHDFLNNNKNNSNIWCCNLKECGWSLIKVLKDMEFKEVIKRSKQFSMPSLVYVQNSFCVKIKDGKLEEIHISEPYRIGICDCSKWFKELPLLNENYPEDEWKFINQIDHTSNNTSPMTGLLLMINNKTRNIDNSDPLNIRLLIKNNQHHTIGGLVHAIPGHYDRLYHYDYLSYYPSILYFLDYLPNLAQTKGPMKLEEFDFDHFMYVTDEGRIIFSPVYGKVYQVPLNIKNPFKYYIKELYKIKEEAPKDSLRRYEVKLQLNGLIGLFTATRNFSTYTDTIERNIGVRPITRKIWSEWYCYITALGRHNFNKIFKIVRKLGGEVVQVNTDGFFTTVPLNDEIVLSDKGLGSLRFEYEGHNVDVYAGNQYACDEEVCIAGLPKQLYRLGQRTYMWMTPKFDKDGTYSPLTKRLTLGRQYIG